MKDWPARSLRRILRTFGLQIHRTHTLSTHEFDKTFLRLTAMRTLGFNPAAICDIGASDGTWSRRCQEVFPHARYFCVDPLVENQPSLARFSGECANVSYWRGCLGSKTGSVTLNVDGHGTSVLSGHTGNPYGIQREVEIETLDNLIQCGVCPEPDLLKLDVQGYELEVLKGAMGALRKTQAVIAELSLFPFQSGMPVFHEVRSEERRVGKECRL